MDKVACPRTPPEHRIKVCISEKKSKQIIELHLEGHSQYAIADRLNISRSTVRDHICKEADPEKFKLRQIQKATPSIKRNKEAKLIALKKYMARIKQFCPEQLIAYRKYMKSKKHEQEKL